MNRTVPMALVVAIGVTCAATVPNKGAHTSVVNEQALASVRKSGVAGAIGAGIMGGFSESMIGSLLEYQSYVLFSTTSNARGATISIGVLGQVFVVANLDNHRK